MSAQVSDLWVERLFSRLQVRYGRQWLAMWEGIEPNAVKADWEETLRDVFARNPKAIAYALENLPERVPTADVFLKLCRQAPWPQLAALPEPVATPDPERVGAALKAMLETKAALVRRGPAQECIDNIERLCNGKPSSAQKAMVQSCLRMPGTSTTLQLQRAAPQPEGAEV